ncbi:PREDICTED: LOW QUALITY PROTEIN: pulmonary surfactant-associated protein D [Pygoscelis adeliae]|uniref:LOW QUALITY PROTEIN: pulmonary surfactant-associated protein D n=1 Tax=Pygoscelis adeliae TaxID=9238 RepID=UPI0004F4E007|nr:PREDICTED: LOW QUALITY PROTEIN: pulmonary surfactant-associated protein D [Pygoscelis adeliae]
MTLLQPFNALVLWLSPLTATSSVNTDKPEEKIYSYPVIQCSAPAVNGLPGRDGRDGPKGERGEPGEGLRGLQVFPGKAGPPGIKGALGPQGEKGKKGERGIVVTDDLQRQVTALETKVQVLEAELNRYKKALILKNMKSTGKKKIVSTGKDDTFDNGKPLCAKAGSALASPRNEAENTALEDLVRPSKQAYLGISDEQTEGRFMYRNGGAVTYRNWNAGEPNNLKNEDCAVIQDSGKWNYVNCSNSRALIICEFLS